MAWRNRIAGTMKSNGFRKMSMEGEDDYDMPLLVQTTSSLATTPSPKSKNLGFKVKGFGKNSKNNNSIGLNSNIAAVPDEVEALSFREEIVRVESSIKRTSNNISPVSIMEETPFVAQFDPANVQTQEGEEKGEQATVFDDETSNDGSIFTGSKDKDTDEEDGDEDDKEQTRSLAPPSLVDTNEFEEEQKLRQIPRALSSKSIAKSSVDNSNTRRSNRTRNTDNSNTRRSSRTVSTDNSNTKRSSRTYIDEDADAATWKADEVDAFVDVDDFGNSSGQSSEPAMEISGINLLTERDNYLGELQEISHLMTFNALVLIQKQKDWIEGSLAATNGANKGNSNMIMMELANLERKIKLLMDNKEWPNEREREKQKIDPLTPSKAFFKAMALIDKSIEQFHRGYLKYMSNTGEENHELKARVDELLSLNASLQEESARSQRKTETIRNLQKERDDLTRKVDRTDEKLASLLPSDDNDRRNSIGSSGKKKESKFHSVRSYIHRLEAEREKHLAEIESLKLAGENIPIDPSHEDGEDEEESLGEICDENHLPEVKKKSSLDLSIITENSDDDSKDNEDTDVLLDDLGSKWHSLQENENAMTLVANKEKQVDRLNKTVTDQETCLDSLRSECKLMRMQLLQLEMNRNEFKSMCEIKDSALAISQDRIATLEEEVLRTQLECATYEEDYQAMKESFDSQKQAAKKGIFHSEDEVKAQFEQFRMEFDEKLERKDEELNEIRKDRERLVRDLKASMEEVETERDNLRAELAKKNAAKPVLLPPIPPTFKDEKKESEENVVVATSPIEEREGVDFEQIQSRFAEKAAKQANTIAQLTEQNEIKDEQLKALHDMVEMLLGNKAEQRSEDNNGKWGQRISKFKLMSQQRATDLMNRSRHGGSMHGSRHGGSIHGSRHGSRHGGSIHVDEDVMEEYSNR